MKRLLLTVPVCIILLSSVLPAAAKDWCSESLKRETFGAAIEACTQAIDARTGDLYANLVNRGSAYSELGMYDAAAADFDHAIELEPKLPKAYNLRGYARALEGRYPEAEKDIRHALEFEPDSTSVIANMVELYALQNRMDLACTWMKKLMEKGEKYWSQIRSVKAQSNMRNSPCFPAQAAGR
ncbi:MAG: hypothetical protein OHK006_11830 [Thermodesulfovibrionales bacterium]